MNKYLKETIAETIRLWGSFVRRLDDPTDWPCRVVALSVMPILIGSYMWYDRNSFDPMLLQFLVGFWAVMYAMSFTITPIQAYFEVRSRKRTAIEARTMLILMWILFPIVPLIALALMAILSYPVRFIYYDIFTHLFGEAGVIFGFCAMLATIPVIWKLMDVTKSTGFLLGTSRALKEIRDQMDDREKVDIYDTDGNKRYTARINKRS